jgi:hypothetical protein
MHADGLVADHEFLRDLTVGTPGHEEGQDLPLARGERGEASQSRRKSADTSSIWSWCQRRGSVLGRR